MNAEIEEAKMNSPVFENIDDLFDELLSQHEISKNCKIQKTIQEISIPAKNIGETQGMPFPDDEMRPLSKTAKSQTSGSF